MPDVVLAHPTTHPFLLLPVRIETRFDGTDLKVRMYPDQVHVDSHEPELTEGEESSGRRYWEAMWRCGGEPVAELAAWDALCAELTVQRAAWVARRTEPTNPADRPTQPVPADHPLSPAPDIPAVPHRASAWTRAALARALPERWRVVAISADRTVRSEAIGLPIRADLAIGPSPDFDASGLAPGDPPVDAGTAWMVDFEAARQAGMALVLPLAATPLFLDVGIDRLLVYGVRADPDPVESGRLLADLLEAHQATDGFGFVAQGTPTNQTSTAAPVPGRHSEAWRAALRVTPDQAVPPAGANARVLADALGLDPGDDGQRPGPSTPPGPAGRPTALARGTDAAVTEQEQAEAMTTLLWPVTWGGFLWQQLDPVLSDAAIGRGRRHAQSYLRAGGPVPTVRVGDQPYGILPIAPLAAWVAQEAPDLDPPGVTAEVVEFIRLLRREVWEPAVAGLPHVAGGGQDPQQTVLRILGMAPTAQRLYGRSLLGIEYFAYLWRFADLELDDDWRGRLRDSADELRTRLGRADWDPRVGRSVFASNSFPIDAPIVRAPSGPGPESYLPSIVGMTPTALRDATATTLNGQTPLLYRLARHAMLTEVAMAADRVLSRQPAPPPASEHLDPELVGIVPGRTDVTLWQRLARSVQTPSGPRPLADYLTAPQPGDPATVALRELRSALTLLAGLDDTVLERLVLETIPLASHRLDAWVTSLATRRLHWMRTRSTTSAAGLHLGAFGWVEGLTPRPAWQQVDPRPAGEQDAPVHRQPDNAGFVHGPSIAQATTAAVLRAAQQAHRAEDSSGDGGPLAVNLPSRRVRLAAWLLDGVRQGQPLGALLGYRFERAVQEHPVGTLAAWIDDFRRLAPVRGTRVAADEPARESVAATDAVDGLALFRLWRAGRLDLDVLGLRQSSHPAERAAALAVLAELADSVDAVADALLAEGVHHAVQGRPMRAAATLDAAAGGESPPPELDSVRTPRTGTAVTHRLIVALPEPSASAGAGSPAWPVDEATQARAHAEPRLDAWLCALLPEPAQVWLRVRIDRPDGGQLHRLLDLRGLRLSALDYVAMPEGGGQGQPSELELHLAGLVAARPDVPAGSVLTFDYVRDARWPAEVVGVAQFLEAVRAVRALVTTARPLEPRDLLVPEAPAVAAEADADLMSRADAAVSALAAAAEALGDPARAREGLRRATALGVPFAVPPPVPPSLDGEPEVQTVLARQVASASAEVARRRALVAALRSDDPEPARSGAVLRAVLGESFPVVASFVPADPAALRPPSSASVALQGGDPFAAVTWATRAARVRPGAGRLVAALSYAEALGTGDRLALDVAQLPFAAGDRWVGLPTTQATPAGSRVGLVVHVAPGAVGQRIAGLVADEWTEVVPNTRETTAVAYHFDTPGASPPQTMLLAVPPDGRAQWNTDLIEATLHEALDLAKLRLVDFEALHPIDPDALTDIGQFLPAAHFALNLAGDVVSTNFTEGL